MSECRVVLAADLGGTHLRLARFGGGQLDEVTTVAHGASPGRPLAIADLQRWLAATIGDKTVAAVGISIAGTVDSDAGLVLVADNLGWQKVPLAGSLQQALGVPVLIETDTLCGATAEARLGGAVGTTLVVAIGTGIGHAWIVNGRVWRGTRSAATMFGHLIVEPGGRPCYCGARGCLCQYAAGPALDAASGGDAEVAAKVGECAREALARAIAQALTLLNPDEVVLGGGAAMGEWLDLDALGARIETLVHTQVRPIRLRRSTLGDRANLLGAGILAEACRDDERTMATASEES